MAANGSTSIAVTSWDTLKFNWWQINQNVVNNTTTIGWNMQLVAGTYGLISSSASKSWSVTVNGTRYSGANTIGVSNNSIKTLASGTTTIAHAADGSKSFSFAFSQEFNITFNGSAIGTKSGSGTGNLNTIPRATQPTLSVSSADMGSTVTINLPRASSAFTHDLAYQFAGGAWTSIAAGVATSYSWTVPDKAAAIPNASSGTMTVRCITKNGSATVGTKTTLLTAKVPASVVPTIGSVITTETTAELAAQFGAFIQGKSAVRATITAAGSKGSTITKYSSTFQGKTYTGSTWTATTVTDSGDLRLVTTVTDSRGRTAQKSTTVTVLPYNPPKVTAFNVRRVNASTGEGDSDGTKASITYDYAVAPLGGKNTASMTVTRKKSTDTTWESVAILTSSSLEGSGTYVAEADFSTDYQWDLRIEVEDWFGAKSTYETSIPSGAVILDIMANGLGISFGKTCERAGVEFGWAPKGAVFGLEECTDFIPSNADLNDYTQPGIYGCTGNAIARTLYNRPTDVAFTLRVYAGVGRAYTPSTYWYMMQELRPYLATEPTYRRTMIRIPSGEWQYETWTKDTVSTTETKNAR